MMSRGGSRGYTPRGGSTYRGRGDGSWNGERGRGRGGFSGPSRGRFNYFKDNSSGFDSRKYSGSSSGERYSTRGRGGGDELGYRRSYHRPDPSYSSRERSHHRSPEPPHKRIRSDSYGSQASSSRRSHEGGYGGGDYNNRYGYPEDKGGVYGEPRGRFREERRSSGYRDRSREEYPHRKPELMMPPPSTTRPRGIYRGRILMRGSRGGMARVLQARRTDSMLIRKKFSDSYALRTRMLASKLQSDAWRKMKIQKLRSRLALNRTTDATDKDVDDDSGEGEADDDEADAEKAEEELEEGETVDKKVIPAKKVKKEKVVEEEREEGEEVDEEEEAAEKDEGKVDGGVQITIKHDSDTRAVSEDSHSRHPIPNYRKHFIRLACPHCQYRCVTFKEYAMHLYSAQHVAAMRKQSLQHKQRLVSMRVNQRQEQRLLEEADEIEGGAMMLAGRTNFCHVCKLNYRQAKGKHVVSESHAAMRKFLIPYCRSCRLSFKSPMLYENHICSLEHIKRKARNEAMAEATEIASGSEADSDEKDLDKYMTLDSVGEVDAAADEDMDEEEGVAVGVGGGGEKGKEDVNPGAEYLRKVEVYFCDLCKLYLPRLDQAERAIAIHCSSRNHLQRYVHCRRDRALRRRAENIHLKESAEKKAEAQQKMAEVKKTSVTPNGSEEPPAKPAASPAKSVPAQPAAASTPKLLDPTPTADAKSGDQKLWADVTKDLADLLDEVVPAAGGGEKGSSDEDEETEGGGRYDKFRYSSRKPEGGVEEEEGGVAASTAVEGAAQQQPPAAGDEAKGDVAVEAAGELPAETADV